MFREDYLMRQIRQLADAIARIAGLNRCGDHEAALAAAERAWGELVGDLPAGMADAVDSRTLADLLRSPERIRLAADLLGEQAAALAARGDATGAARCERRAAELRLAAQAAEASRPGVI